MGKGGWAGWQILLARKGPPKGENGGEGGPHNSVWQHRKGIGEEGRKEGGGSDQWKMEKMKEREEYSGFGHRANGPLGDLVLLSKK
jgi:hypothetical protein